MKRMGSHRDDGSLTINIPSNTCGVPAVINAHHPKYAALPTLWAEQSAIFSSESEGREDTLHGDDDGIVDICERVNVAEPGISRSTIIVRCYHRDFRIWKGCTRNYVAKQAGDTLDEVIRWHWTFDFAGRDIASIDGSIWYGGCAAWQTWWRIPITVLSLERRGVSYARNYWEGEYVMSLLTVTSY